MTVRIRFLFFLLLLPLLGWGQQLLPPIQNYPIFEYNAASQNWGLTINAHGELFVANNKGLLHFNGEQWVLYKLPNNTIVRSVAHVGDRIYTGSYEEFGYWAKSALGGLEYTSLTHLIRDHEFNSEEFWQIVPYGNEIVFRSFSRIYIYGNGGIRVIDPGFVVTNVVVFQERLLVAGNDVGLFELYGEVPKSIKNLELLKTASVVDMVTTKGGLLIGTKLNGFYLWKGNGNLEQWGAALQPELRLHQLNKMVALSNGKIGFGTIKNGVYLYDPRTGGIDRINKATGLQNNTVLAMQQFKDQLWIGMDNGLDRIQLNAPVTYFTDYTGTVGTVYDLAVHKGILYLGSNTGVYYFKDNELRFVNGSQGHVWDLEVIDDMLFCGHNTGTYSVDLQEWREISNYSGGYQIVKVPEKMDTYIQGTYNGLSTYVKTPQGKWEVFRISGLDFPIKQLCFESPTVIWAAHPYKGFFRIALEDGLKSVKEGSIEQFPTMDIPNKYNVKLYNIKNQIVIQSGGRWYKYDPIAQKIVPFKEFDAFTTKELVHYGDDHYWFIDNEGTKEITYTDLNDVHMTITGNQMVKRLVPDAENVVKSNDSIYFFTLSDGFAKINLPQLLGNATDRSVPMPKLGFFRDALEVRDILEMPIEVKFKHSRDIEIQVAAPMLAEPRFYYELKGAEQESAHSESGTLAFQNLPFGRYDLFVSTLDINNQKSEPLRIRFEISPPWYFSRVMTAVYIAMLLVTLWLIRVYNRRKLQRHHDRLLLSMQLQQEEKLRALEKEKLAKEIKDKQKELTGTTMNVAKKNELILELKNMLLVNKEKFSNQQRYRSFIKKLDSSINDDDDWKKFEVNFKELHEDFFEKLLLQFPDLTPKDLKLCAYLKMNLSSKEIAPLMGISTRGVEIHRYRLRKKLSIDSSQNISNFLITFK
tara:strand:+ start:60987 stop:63752 length:2766 start_codon:yes stop_codon:yes gene_type:complete